MLLTILVNVIVFDIFFLDKYGALASAVIYTLLLVVILWINRFSLINAMKTLTSDQLWKTKWPGLLTFILAGLVMALIFGLDQFVVNLLGHGEG